MNNFLNQMKMRAKQDKKTIVLAEGEDIRTIQATVVLLREGVANIILLGDEEKIRSTANGYDISDARIIDPRVSEHLQDFADTFFEMRKSKGVTPEQARKTMQDPLYFGVMMVKKDLAHGMVAGAVNATANVLRPSLQILKTAPGTKLISSFFIMVVPNCQYGENGVFLYSDCGMVENPNADELSEIAISSAKSFRNLVDATPNVALLSYSTYGSAKSELTEKVIEATRLAKEKRPDLNLDGELQVDAAIVPAIGNSKAPQSSVAGSANVLVFPNLDAGNIAYKLTQRLGNAEAYGPISQGIAKPVNDLSRGCDASDIVGVVAITCVQAQSRE